MTFNGAWANAMEEVVRACAYLAETHNVAVADALYQRAELCRLRGQLDEAEAFYTEASERGREAQPGLALVRLAQGQTATAAAALRRALAEDHAPLERARLLAPYIEVLLATDDVTEAGVASDELTAIAGRIACRYLDALAARASARWHWQTARRPRRSTSSARHGARGAISRCRTRPGGHEC